MQSSKKQLKRIKKDLKNGAKSDIIRVQDLRNLRFR